MGLMDMFTESKERGSTEPAKAQKALAYIRVSHEDSADRGTSLESQRQDIERYAAAESIEIVTWFDEPGKSAFKDDGRRKEFARMVCQAKESGDISLILVWKSDRFCRDRYQAAAVKGELAKAGVRVLSVLEPYDSTTTGGMVIESVTDVMNQIRSIEIGQVTHRNLLTNCEMRDPVTGWSYKNGGWAQFGYQNHRVFTDTDRKYQRQSHCIWLLDEEQLAGKPIHEWARTMLIDWRLGEKAGADVLARKLTEAGIPTPSGRRAWSDSTINGLLMPEALLQYAGYALWNRRDFKNGGKRAKDKSEWKFIEKAHPPIITLEEAEAIQAIREARTSRRIRQGGRPSPFVLSGGLLTCARCGANYAGRIKHENDYYVCGAEIYRHGADCGEPWYIRRESIEQAVLECIKEFYSADSLHLKKVIADHNKVVELRLAQHPAWRERREEEIERLNQEIGNLTQSLADGVDSRTVRAAINDRAAQLEKLNTLDQAPLPKKIMTKELQAQAAEICRILEAGNPDQKRSAIRRYIGAMQADPENRLVKSYLHPISSLCCHGVVAPGGVEPPPRP